MKQLNRFKLIILFLTLGLLIPSLVLASSAFLSPNPKFMALDANGDPYAGAKLYTYKTGTTTPKTTWTDYSKGTANTNPVILDSKGQADIWIDSADGAYRFKLDNTSDVTLWTKDSITAEGASIGVQLREAYALATGTNTYTTTMDTTLLLYTLGDHYLITFPNTNTSTTPTLEIDSLGAKTMKGKGGGALSAGSISNDHPSILKYDGTDLILLNATTVSDTAYDVTSWDGVLAISPSKNAVRDMRVAAISDTVYDVTTWDGVITIAPSKNAVRDMREAIPKDPAAGTAGLRTIGTTALKACAGNDSRLSDARTPTGAAVVPQSMLKTSTGSVSIYNNTANHTLPGGEYGFFPQVKTSAGGGITWRGAISTAETSYTVRINLGADGASTAYARQRYVTSSGEVFWIFILRNKTTKQTISMYQAPDHPCFGNGSKPLLVPHPFGSFDETKHEIIVINPSLEEIEQMELETIIDDETKPDKDLLEVITENYEVDEGSSPAWPSIPVTVGLPKYIKDKKTGKRTLVDYRFMRGDSVVVPIKKVIPKPDYIKVRSLKRKMISGK